MKYPHLFQPVQIGKIILKNRIVMSQMTMNYATPEGFPTEKMIHYYLERAKGGVSLIFVEGTFITPEGKGYKNQLGLISHEHAERLRRLTESIRELKNDIKIFIQIQHAGGRAYQKITGFRPVAPSGFPLYPGADIPHPLSKEEIKSLVNAHVEAALRAKEAGFDGVDIHCAHGYLIPEFFSPLFNKREDEYGGDIIGRTRFLMEIIRGIKGTLGKDFPLTIKISGDEYVEGGLGINEMKEIVILAQHEGIDAVMVSAGTVGGKKIEDLTEAHKVLRTMPMMTQPACLVSLAEEMKKVLKIPVIAVGRIHRPNVAEEIIREGKADLVAMGRALLADPYLPRKAFEGKEDEIRPCIGCNEGCYKRIFQQLDIRCSINPVLGKESEIIFQKISKPKKIFIFGGGPSGLEAAYTAWAKGHEVVILEKSGVLGGQLNLASIPPGRKEIQDFKEYLINRLKKTNIKVIFGENNIKRFIKETCPEAIILAIGARPRIQEIPGLRLSHSVTAWEILSGENEGKEPYLILGGGLVGCETADYLSDQGRKVILVEILPEIASEADADTKTYFDLRFKKNGVEIYTNTKFLRMEDKYAILKRDIEEIKVKVETIVFAIGADANNDWEDNLSNYKVPVFKIGDCLKPRGILEAVREGFQVGITL